MLRRSDWTLHFSVRSEGISASDCVEKTNAVLIGLWLRPVGVHRTRPVMIPGDLDLSGIDRTLGDRIRAAYELLLHFLLNPMGDPFIIERHSNLAPYPRRLHRLSMLPCPRSRALPILLRPCRATTPMLSRKAAVLMHHHSAVVPPPCASHHLAPTLATVPTDPSPESL